jgi:hypothetical protein
VLAVRRPVAVRVVVRLVEGCLGEKRAVVALLQLDGLGTGILRRHEELAALLDIALVVVADLGDDVALRRVVDDVLADRQAFPRFHALSSAGVMRGFDGGRTERIIT